MNTLKKLGVLFSAILLLAGCSTGQSAEKTIRVGSKDFTENLIISEIYALALEAEGYTVERVQNIAGSLVHTAITNDEIDLYPEYTGTGLLTVLQMDLLTDPVQVYETVKKEYNEKFQITWLEYSEANDSAGLVIRADIAKELGIKTISDLQKHASTLRFASQGEFDQRADGIPLLTKVYGAFDWKETNIYDNGLKYEILKTGKADVAPAYTTEGELINKDTYLILEDDKKIWPPYNIAPIVRNQVLSDNPEIEAILNKISDKLNNEIVIELNAKVDIEKQEYEDVAKEFFATLA